MSQAEAAALGQNLSAMVTLGLETLTTEMGGLAPGLVGGAATRSTASGAAVPVEWVAICPGGGSINLSGEAVRSSEASTDTVDVTFDLGARFTNCSLDAGGRALFVSGQLSLQAERHRVSGEPAGLQTASLSGTLQWRTGSSAEATCPVDVQSELDPDASQLSVTGTVCGHSVSRTDTWTPPRTG